MPRQLFKTDKLAKQLEPYRFQLNLPETRKGGISFVRRSSVERLFEHLLISATNPAYAEVVISASSFTICHSSVSERDSRLRALLSDGCEFRTTTLNNSFEAQQWLQKLIDKADEYCTLASVDCGPLLVSRLHPFFESVDAYVDRLDDIYSIFDHEHAFLLEASAEEQHEIDRLATHSYNMLYLDLDDSKLAALILSRYSYEVDGCSYLDKVPHRDTGLAARLVLLAEFVSRRRMEYSKLNRH